MVKKALDLLAGTIAAALVIDSVIRRTIPGFLLRNDFNQCSLGSPFLSCGVSKDIQSFHTSEIASVKSPFVLGFNQLLFFKFS